MNGQCAQLESRMREIIKSDRRLADAFSVLRTICGVGELSAFAFLGEIGLGDQFRSADKLKLFAG